MTARAKWRLPSGAITDVVAVGSENNVGGSITTTSGTTQFSASALAPLGTSSPFYSALYNGTSIAGARSVDATRFLGIRPATFSNIVGR